MLAVNLVLRNKTVLVIGGGSVGRRKLRKLLHAQAFIRVVEPRPNSYLLDLAAQKLITLVPEFHTSLLDGVCLVFAASSDHQLNRQAAEEAQKRNIWVNLADDPHNGDFFLPAVIDRGAFRLTVSTGGGGPALAAVAAERLKQYFGPEYGCLAEFLAVIRPVVLNSGLTAEERKSVFHRLAGSSLLLELLARNETARLADLTKTLLEPVAIEDAVLQTAIQAAALAADNENED